MSDLLAVSFTASRDLDAGGREVVLNVLTTGIPLADRYITGGCIGGDAFIGRWLYENRPEAEHVVVVPWDKSRVDPWWLAYPLAGPELVFMPRGSTYADRNGRLVTAATAVCGLPAYPEDHSSSLRSGTWQTIRLARRAGKLCRWDCIKPPFSGRIEKYLGEFAADRD